MFIDVLIFVEKQEFLLYLIVKIHIIGQIMSDDGYARINHKPFNNTQFTVSAKLQNSPDRNR